MEHEQQQLGEDGYSRVLAARRRDARYYRWSEAICRISALGVLLACGLVLSQIASDGIREAARDWRQYVHIAGLVVSPFLILFAIGAVLNGRVARRYLLAVYPSDFTIEHGPKYCCMIDRSGDGHSGTVWDEDGVARWKFGVRPARSPKFLPALLRRREFVCADQSGAGEFVISRVSFVPPAFRILQNGVTIGRIQLRSLLRNKYSIELRGVDTWTFWMPIFRVKFHGELGGTSRVWVGVGPSKMEWLILIEPERADPALIAALAFIHTQWWNYG